MRTCRILSAAGCSLFAAGGSRLAVLLAARGWLCSSGARTPAELEPRAPSPEPRAPSPELPSYRATNTELPSSELPSSGSARSLSLVGGFAPRSGRSLRQSITIKGCASALPPLQPATSISAAPARRSSTGSTPGATAARSCCASRTPTPSGRRGRWSPVSSEGCAGSGSTGTRGRTSAARTRRTSSRSASIAIARWPTSSSRKAAPTTATARPN